MTDVVEIEDVRAMRSTKKALLVKIGARDPVWIPRSQIPPWSQVSDAGHKGTLVLARWLALKLLDDQPSDPRPATVNLDGAARIYRKLANKWHPDHRGPVATEFMQDINSLWSAVRDAVGGR